MVNTLPIVSKRTGGNECRRGFKGQGLRWKQSLQRHEQRAARSALKRTGQTKDFGATLPQRCLIYAVYIVTLTTIFYSANLLTSVSTDVPYVAATYRAKT